MPSAGAPVAVVTGASAGVGRAMAVECARHGYCVGLMARGREGLRESGRIDVWGNDAMATVFSSVRDITPAEFRRVTKVTYPGPVYGTMARFDRRALDAVTTFDPGLLRLGAACAALGLIGAAALVRSRSPRAAPLTACRS